MSILLRVAIQKWRLLSVTLVSNDSQMSRIEIYRVDKSLEKKSKMKQRLLIYIRSGQEVQIRENAFIQELGQMWPDWDVICSWIAKPTSILLVIISEVV